MCDDCLVPLWAVRRELWKLAALKSPKECEEPVLLVTILPRVVSEATDTGALSCGRLEYKNGLLIDVVLLSFGVAFTKGYD